MSRYDHDRPRPVSGERPPATWPTRDDGLWLAMARYLAGRHLPPTLAVYNGWYPSRDAGDKVPRAVIPASSTTGVFWQARALDDIVTVRYQSPSADRGDALILLRPWRRDGSRPWVVCEGPMDALAAAALGYEACALMGNTPPEVVRERLVELTAGRAVLVVADSDSPAASGFVVGYLSGRGCVKACHLVVPVGAKDLAGLAPDQRLRLLRPLVYGDQQ